MTLSSRETVTDHISVPMWWRESFFENTCVNLRKTDVTWLKVNSLWILSNCLKYFTLIWIYLFVLQPNGGAGNKDSQSKSQIDLTTLLCNLSCILLLRDDFCISDSTLSSCVQWSVCFHDSFLSVASHTFSWWRRRDQALKLPNPKLPLYVFLTLLCVCNDLRAKPQTGECQTQWFSRYYAVSGSF